jgi:hypothetical protein
LIDIRSKIKGKTGKICAGDTEVTGKRRWWCELLRRCNRETGRKTYRGTGKRKSKRKRKNCNGRVEAR